MEELRTAAELSHNSQVETGKKVKLFERWKRIFHYYHTSYIIILKSQFQAMFNFASSDLIWREGNFFSEW